jgi:cholesterol transport system auxiliary component
MAAALLGALLSACAITPPAVEEPGIFLLDARPVLPRAAAPSRAVLAVSPPRARPGFETPRMAYVRQPHQLEYFSKSRWADTPARMLAPLLVQALAQGGAFSAVVQSPGPVAGTLRLDTEIVRLQQEFGAAPGQVRITLRAQLVDLQARRVIATREFEEVEAVAADNAYAGVSALNRALDRLLPRLADFVRRQVA